MGPSTLARAGHLRHLRPLHSPAARLPGHPSVPSPPHPAPCLLCLQRSPESSSLPSERASRSSVTTLNVCEAGLLCLQALVSEILGPSKVMLVVKNPPDSAGDVRAAGLISVLGRSPGGGNGNPLQYSHLENPMDRGAGWATVYRVAKSRDRTEVTLHSPCLQTVVIKSPNSFR